MSELPLTRGYSIIHTIKDLADEGELELCHLVRGPMRRDGSQWTFFTDYHELYPVREFKVFRRRGGGKGPGRGLSKLQYSFDGDCPLELLEVRPLKPWAENTLHYVVADEPLVLPHAETLDYLPDAEYLPGERRGHLKSILIDKRNFEQLKKLAGVNVADSELDQLHDFIKRVVAFADRLDGDVAIIRRSQRFGAGAAVHSEWLTTLRNWLSYAKYLQRPDGSWDELDLSDLAEEASGILRSTWRSFRPLTRKTDQ